MTTALKNWEAQAKTNSILAGSLKALEERIDALGIFVEWKDAMDVEVAAMQDTLDGLREAMTAMEKEKKRGKLMGAALAGLSRRNIGGGAQEDTTPTTFMGKLVAQAVSPIPCACMAVVSAGCGTGALAMLEADGITTDDAVKANAGLFGASAVVASGLALAALSMNNRMVRAFYLAFIPWLDGAAATTVTTALKLYVKNDRFQSQARGFADDKCAERKDVFVTLTALALLAVLAHFYIAVYAFYVSGGATRSSTTTLGESMKTAFTSIFGSSQAAIEPAPPAPTSAAASPRSTPKKLTFESNSALAPVATPDNRRGRSATTAAAPASATTAESAFTPPSKGRQRALSTPESALKIQL